MTHPGKLAARIAAAWVAAAWVAAAVIAAPAALDAQGLFKRTEPLEFSITTNLGKLIGDRDSTGRQTHPGELAYTDSAGAVVKVPVALRTRGHFRRQFRNCNFPPLKVEMTKAAAKNTVFEGNRTLKLASNCRPGNNEYEQYILQEAAVYRMYQAITPWSYRTRLAHVTYQDSTGKMKPVRSWAFFVEDENDLAQRRNVKKFETKGAYYDDLDAEHWGNVQLFQYMIGNSDWSVAGLHNMTLLKDSTSVIHPVPYDFDWSGAVDARYAFPDASLSLRSVRDRIWRGDCRPLESLLPTIELFTMRRAALDSAYTTVGPLAPELKERMRKYFAEFWSLVENPKRAASEFKRTCSDRH